MRLLRNIVLIVLPILLMVNIYNWIFTSASGNEWVAQSNFKGFSYIHQYMTTFPGIESTLSVINTIQEYGTIMSSIEINNVADVFNAVGKILQIVGMGLSVPVIIVVDLVRDLMWFINILFIQN